MRDTLLFLLATSGALWRRADARTLSQSYGAPLCTLANDFRAENGLPPLAPSYTMEMIAQAHLDNLIENNHNLFNTQCNLHSWYTDTIYDSPIAYCCYPATPCMAAKAQELTARWQTGYTSSAAENTYASSGSGFGAQASPERVIDSWKNSLKHRQLLLTSTGATCGAVLNYTYTPQGMVNSLALLWIGMASDQVSYSYDGEPVLIGQTTCTTTTVRPTTTTSRTTTSTAAATTRVHTTTPLTSTSVASTSTIRLTTSPSTFATLHPTPSRTLGPTPEPTDAPTVEPTLASLPPIPYTNDTMSDATDFVFTESMYIATAALCICCIVAGAVTYCMRSYIKEKAFHDANVARDILLYRFEQHAAVDPDSQRFTREYFRQVREAEDHDEERRERHEASKQRRRARANAVKYI